MSFAQVFGRSYSTLSRLSAKPMMIAETASAEQGGQKAQWIAKTFGALPSRFPRIRAAIWFDRNKETDWRINSSAASLVAWRKVVASTTYRGTPATLLRDLPTSEDADSRILGAVSGRLGLTAPR
jgi:hypothetical protein